MEMLKKILVHPLMWGMTVILSAFILQSCEKVNSPMNEGGVQNKYSLVKSLNVPQLRTDMKILAKSLARVLQDENNRRYFESMKNAANNREDILDASLFLNSVVTSDGSTILDLMLNYIPENNRGRVKNTIKNLNKGIYDIYFPIKEQRENWKSSDELQIAVYDMKTIRDTKKVVAYDLQGNEKVLDISKKPETPTLVVALSETHGNYPKKDSNQFYQSLMVNSTLATTTEETGPTYSQLYCYTWFCREAVGDAWDSPEYYLHVAYPQNSGWVDTYFPEVTSSGTGYYGLNRVCYTYNAIVYYNSTRYVQMWVMEDDGGWYGDDDVIQDQWGLSDNDPNISDLVQPPIGSHCIYIGHLAGADFESSRDEWVDMGWQLK